MERTINTKFFEYRQNNSGGSFYRNDDVREIVIIEAQNAKEANFKFREISESYMDFCSCCGERWYFLYDDDAGEDKPMGQDEPFTDFYMEKWHDSYTIVIYYYDGVKRFFNATGEEVPGGEKND